MMPEVAVALSGGVDSSVAAALLVETGRDVFGVTMQIGSSDDAVEHAREVCETLGIEHVVIDVADEFHAEVVEPFCDAYASGLTPNPCVRCNERIKFGLLADRVRTLGAAILATGHYARLVSEDGRMWLERGADPAKDQSYFLYRIAPETLAMLEFPLGGLTKADVRQMAAERGLPAAEKRDSQEVCFTHDHTDLLAATHPEALEPGPIETADGTLLGKHRGIARYTVGQRKGLGVGGPDGPYEVVCIDAARHALVVAPAGESRTTSVTLADPVWHLAPGPAPVLAQVRYRARPVSATATPRNAGLAVVFGEPADVLAPGQSVVLYQQGRVVGGGIVPAG